MHNLSSHWTYFKGIQLQTKKSFNERPKISHSILNILLRCWGTCRKPWDASNRATWCRLSIKVNNSQSNYIACEMWNVLVWKMMRDSRHICPLWHTTSCPWSQGPEIDKVTMTWTSFWQVGQLCTPNCLSLASLLNICLNYSSRGLISAVLYAKSPLPLNTAKMIQHDWRFNKMNNIKVANVRILIRWIIAGLMKQHFISNFYYFLFFGGVSMNIHFWEIILTQFLFFSCYSSPGLLSLYCADCFLEHISSGIFHKRCRGWK